MNEPKTILDLRLARGEITKEEYLDLLTTISLRPASARDAHRPQPQPTLQERNTDGFWTSGLGLTIRWISFLPIGMTLAVLLQDSLPLLVMTVQPVFRAPFGILRLLLDVLITPILLVYLFVTINLGWLVCAKIAPSRRIGAIIFSLAFVVFQTFYLIVALSDPNVHILGIMGLVCVYHLVFTFFLVGASFAWDPFDF